MQCLENKVFDDINIGDTAKIKRVLTKQNIQLFAMVTGDMNPAHLDENYAKTDIFHQIVGHGMWTGSMFSSLLGMYLPGPGTIYIRQDLKFLRPVKLGDEITASVKVTAKNEKNKHLTLETICVNHNGEKVIEGEAEVLAPTEKVKWQVTPLPNILYTDEHQSYLDAIIKQAAKLRPLKTAVVHPVDTYSLQGAIEAAKAGAIIPILIGPEQKIRAVAAELKIDLSGYEIHPTKHSHEAAEVAVKMAREAQVEAIMKGKISTEELMQFVVDKENGIRTGRRMSHVFVVDVPSYPKPLLISDAAINIAPTLMEKKDITQNAIDLFHALGLGTPMVAILSAVETVNEKIPSTIDATALCKMAERGQITGAVVDGPLAFDNAVSAESAAIKGLVSEVAGKADILIVPDIESGNMLYKQLRYFSGAQGMGMVMGAKVPIILTSRAGDAESRVGSSAMALIYARSKNP